MHRLRSTRAAVWLIAAVVLAGCMPEGETAPEETVATASQAPEPSDPATASSPTPTPTPSPSPTGAAQLLGEEWEVDSDSDSVPDFLEESAGYDPQVDECDAEINCPGPAGTNAADLSRDQNTLLMLDSSGSMAASAGGGRTKMQAARDALERYATATPDFINLGFLVYGHEGSNEPSGKAESCRAVDVLAPLGKVNYKTFPKVLASFEPTGYTPIAAALEEAGEAFAGREDAVNHIIMVSDGIETCDGDPVAAARQLAKAGIAVTVDVVGFGVEDTDVKQLRAIAKATGGTYTSAPTGDALDAYFDELYERRLALSEQFGCVVRKGNRIFACMTRYSTLISSEISALLREEDDAAVRNAMIERRREIMDELRARRDALVAEKRERMAEISKAIERVRRRMRRRYGVEVGALFDCPLDGQMVAFVERV